MRFSNFNKWWYYIFRCHLPPPTKFLILSHSTLFCKNVTVVSINFSRLCPTFRVVRLAAAAGVLDIFAAALLRCRSAVDVDVAGFALLDSTFVRRPCPAVDSASACVAVLVRTAIYRGCNVTGSKSMADMDSTNKLMMLKYCYLCYNTIQYNIKLVTRHM